MLRALVVAVVVASAGDAYAIGLCEDTPTRYDAPELFDPKTQSFAVNVTRDWCDVVQAGNTFDEARGTVSYVELRDAEGNVLGVLSTARGDEAERLTAMESTFEAIPLGKLHATLVKRGYAPLITHTKAKPGCKLATSWGPPGSPGGWREAPLELDVTAGGKRVLRLPLGDGAVARRGDQILRAAFGAATIAVFAIVPSCAGPPPGYFGPDDTGTCYPINTPVTLALDVKTHPELAACF